MVRGSGIAVRQYALICKAISKAKVWVIVWLKKRYLLTYIELKIVPEATEFSYFENFRGYIFTKFLGCWLPNRCQSIVAIYIETSQLICRANQMTGFYMECNIELKCVKEAEKRLNKTVTWNVV